MADIKIGNLEIDNLKVGTLSVDALYIGDVKIYPSTPPPTPTVLPKYFEHTTLLSGDTIPQGYIAGIGNIADATFISRNMVLGDYPNGVCCEITTSSYFQGDIVRDSTNTPTRAPQVDVYYNYKNSGGTLCEGIDVTGTFSSNNWMPFSRKGCSGNIVSMYYEDGTHINHFGYANYLCEIHPIDSANTKYNMFTYDDAINNSEKCYGIKIDIEQVYEDGCYFTVEGVSTLNENNEETYIEGLYYFVYNDGQWGVFSGTSPDDFIEYIDDTTGVFNFGGDLGKFGGMITVASEELLESSLYLLQEHIPTLQWVEFAAGDTIPSTLNVYGISGDSEYLMDTFSDSTEPFYVEPYRRTFDIYLLNRYYEQTDNVNYIFSDMTWSDLGDYINFNTDKTIHNYPFKLYIYA